MIDEKALRELLIALAEHQVTTLTVQQSMLAEITALRETVKVWDPAFAEIIEVRRDDFLKSNALTSQELIVLSQALVDAAKNSFQ